MAGEQIEFYECIKTFSKSIGGVAFLHKDILQGTATPYTILNNLCPIALATQTIMFLLISCVRNFFQPLVSAVTVRETSKREAGRGAPILRGRLLRR